LVSIRLLPLALLLALVAADARAQGEVRVQMEAVVNATRVQVGDTFQLDVSLSLENVQGEPDELSMPDVSAFELVSSGRGPTSQRTTIVNGRVSASRSLTFTYQLKATTPGKKTIPSGRVRAGGKTSTSRPISIEVMERAAPAKPGRSSALDPTVRFNGKRVPPYFLDARFDADEVYVGQQLLFRVQVYATGFVDLDLRSLETPKPPGFWVEVLESPTRIRPSQRTIGDKTFLVYDVLTVALFPLEAGQQNVTPISLKVTTRSGRSWQELQLSSDPVVVDVKPLPEADRPPDFSEGNVGHWKLRAGVSSKKVPEGEPVTLRLIASGEGNVNAVVMPDIQDSIRGARVFPPTQSESKSVQAGRLYGEKKLEVLVQPTETGRFEIPAFELPYFDPDTATWARARTTPIVVQVSSRNAGAGGAGSDRQQLAQGARPIRRGLRPAQAAASLLASPLFASSALAIVVAGAGFTLAGWRRGRRAGAPDAVARRRRKDRRAKLRVAREERNLRRGGEGAAPGRPRRAPRGSPRRGASWSRHRLARGCAGGALRAEDRRRRSQEAPRRRGRARGAPRVRREGGLVNRALLLLGIMLFAGAAPDARASSSAQQLAEAEGLALGDNAGAAVDAYDALLASGIDTPDLRYNLGTLQLQQGELGQAVLHLRAALRARPRDGDARFNLERALEARVDQVVGEARARRPTAVVAGVVSADEAAVFLLVALALFFACLAARAWLSPGAARRALGYGVGIFALVLLGASLVAGLRSLHDAESEAVVLAGDVPARAGPSADARETFTAHAGLYGVVVEQEAGYSRVRLDNGLDAWLPDDALAFLGGSAQ
jgi:hypothetical protein